FVEETFAGSVGLDPFAIDDELRDSAFAGALDDFVHGAGGGFDIDVFIGNVVLGEKAFGLAAVGAPGGGIDGEFHGLILEVRIEFAVALCSYPILRPVPSGVGCARSRRCRCLAWTPVRRA